MISINAIPCYKNNRFCYALDVWYSSGARVSDGCFLAGASVLEYVDLWGGRMAGGSRSLRWVFYDYSSVLF